MSKERNPAFNISVSDFTYDLPASRIAAYPLEQRDMSKLLVYRDNKIKDAVFRELPSCLDPGSVMVFNNTRVIQARLEFFKESGARIEIFCLHPELPSRDIQRTLASTSPARWFCLVGNAKKWKSGELSAMIPEKGIRLYASLSGKKEEGYLVDFRWEPENMSFADILEAAGNTPLPPYIQRRPEASDKKTYQTVFARDEGSVAAPTAGLHFTPWVLNNLKKSGVNTRELTLHVGAGTFKPVTGRTIGEHTMHSEEFHVSRGFLRDLLQAEGPVIAVGTTSMRTLESLYWLGVRICEGKNPEGALRQDVSQWEPYGGERQLPTAARSLGALLDWMDKEGLDHFTGETSLIIVPGYEFKITDVLLTNFHQPGSTLLLLVAAFIGDDWRQAYRHALEKDYRFLSYGDACLFFRNPKTDG